MPVYTMISHTFIDNFMNLSLYELKPSPSIFKHWFQASTPTPNMGTRIQDAQVTYVRQHHTSEMPQWVKAFAPESDELSSISGTYIVEERPESHKLFPCVPWCECMLVPAQPCFLFQSLMLLFCAIYSVLLYGLISLLFL